MLLDEFEFIDLDELLDEVSPDEVPGCPPVLVKKHVRRALRTFCRRSQWWRATLDAQTLAKGVAAYSLEDLPDNVKVHTLEWVKISGRTLRDNEYSLSDDGRELVLTNVPVQTVRNALLVRAILVPTRNCTQVGDHLVDEWGNVIGAGALASLRSMPGRAWTNLGAAGINTQTFEAGIVRARNAADRNRKNEELNTKRRRFSV